MANLKVQVLSFKSVMMRFIVCEQNLDMFERLPSIIDTFL